MFDMRHKEYMQRLEDEAREKLKDPNYRQTMYELYTIDNNLMQTAIKHLHKLAQEQRGG